MASPVVAIRRSRAFHALAWVTRPLRMLVDLAYVYEFDLTTAVPVARAAIPIQMAPASHADVVAAADIAGSRFRDTFLHRLDEGVECFVAKIGDRVVAYNWTRYRSGEDEGDVLHLRPDEIYTCDAFTAEDVRGRGIHSETLAYMLQVARNRGYRRAYTMHSVLKRASRKALRGIGWKLSGRVLRVRVGRRYAVLRLSGSARPFRAGAA